jgi:hypothetical protein
MGRQATLFDRLLEAVSEEHIREAKSWPSSSAERRRECVKSLLAGELVITPSSAMTSALTTSP